MKCFVVAKELHIDISCDEIEQMIREKLFMENEPTADVLINCCPAKVVIPLSDNDFCTKQKCDCWMEDDGGRCSGTKEIDLVSCNGDKSKCIYNKLSNPQNDGKCKTCSNRLNYKWCYFEGCKDLPNRP